jgi:signal transduction histidine kinase
MFDIRPGRRRKTAACAMVWMATAAPCAKAFAGNAGAHTMPLLASTAFWAFMVTALVLVAGLAYALGAWRAGAVQHKALFEARNALHLQHLLQNQTGWRTDALHHWRHWQAPGRAIDDAADAAPMAPAEQPPFGPLLQAELRAQRAFSGLRLRAAHRWHGAQWWELHGVPCLDDRGRFAGFVGTARPLDEASQLSLMAQALQPALQAQAGAALLVAQWGSGWQVLAFNQAASQLWPTLSLGADWTSLATALAVEIPMAVLSDIEATLQASEWPGSAAPKPSQTEAAGWRFEVFDADAQGKQELRGLLLTQRPAAPAPPAAAESATQESDSFSFTVSHDLRAPIRVVEGFTRIVKEDYGKLLDRVGNDHLDRVLGAAARMNLMIDALLTLARLSTQPLAQQPVNLSQLATYIIDDLRRGAPEREADVDIEPALMAHGDPTLLRLVLENLLGNAWKYSARCHRTQISLRTVPHAGPPGINAGRAFCVRDNGAGFDMRSAERLFGLFQRLHSNSDFPGHGVGLASVRRIVKRHGGDIWAEAEVGRGAAFFFTLAG